MRRHLRKPPCFNTGRKVFSFLTTFVGVTVPLVGLAAFWGFGAPSLSRARADIDRTLGARTADVVGAGCTHVAGDFWTVWPMVFHANLVLYERGEPRVVWGVAHNSVATTDLWTRTPAGRMRVAVRPEEFWLADDLFKSYGYASTTVVGTLPTVRVFRPDGARVATVGKGLRR